MSKILRKLPFFDRATTLRIPGGPVVDLKHDQIILWVSITGPGLPECPPETPRFPAVLDTGFNDNFLIQEQHLTAWAGLSPRSLDCVEFMSAYGQNVPLLDADVWLYRNQSGHRDQLLPSPPFRLELKSGVGVCPVPVSAPRLPLLGVRGLRRAGLQLFADFHRCRVWLRTRRRFWLFG